MTREPSRAGWLAGTLLLALMSVVHYDVIFQGRSLVLTNHYNPLDYRPLAENYGPNFVPHEVWTLRNLFSYANIRDPGASWWQWEPSRVFLRRAIETREWPFWDPYVGAGRNQEPDRVHVLCIALAEDDGFVECGPAQIVDVVDLDAGLQQPADDVCVSAFCGPDQSRAIHVLNPEVAIA